jgi:hypothetical protein
MGLQTQPLVGFKGFTFPTDYSKTQKQNLTKKKKLFNFSQLTQIMNPILKFSEKN